MELNVFTWFLRKANITWIFQKLNFSTNYYGIKHFAYYIDDSAEILTDHPTGSYSISGITVIHWGCVSTSSSHDSRKSVRLTSNLCHTKISRITKNSRQYSSCFIISASNVSFLDKHFYYYGGNPIIKQNLSERDLSRDSICMQTQ